MRFERGRAGKEVTEASQELARESIVRFFGTVNDSMKRGIGMSKNLLKGAFAALLTLAMAGPAFAQNTVADGGGLGADESGAGTLTITRTASTTFNAGRYQCSDPTLTSSTISLAVADCCISGDNWRGTMYKGTKQKLFAHTTNLAGFGPGAAVLAPNVFGPTVTIGTAVKKVDVLVTGGNNAPGGLPADYFVRVATNGGGPSCVLRQNLN
jgi:hypothetical protein